MEEEVAVVAVNGKGGGERGDPSRAKSLQSTAGECSHIALGKKLLHFYPGQCSHFCKLRVLRAENPAAPWGFPCCFLGPVLFTCKPVSYSCSTTLPGPLPIPWQPIQRPQMCCSTEKVILLKKSKPSALATLVLQVFGAVSGSHVLWGYYSYYLSFSRSGNHANALAFTGPWPPTWWYCLSSLTRVTPKPASPFYEKKVMDCA